MTAKRKHNQPTEDAALDAIGALADSKKSFMTRDGYQNLFSNLGINTNNQSSGGSYDFGKFITRQPLLLEAAYRTSWIIGQIVDVIADDMTRSGIELQSDLKPDQILKMDQAMVRLGVWKGLTSAIKWGRLYGGAVAIICIQGQKFDQPLRLETVGKGSFKGILVLDRWNLDPSLGELVKDFGPDFGLPKYYKILPSSNVLSSERVHHTRLIRFEGTELPLRWRVAESLWSASIVERLFDQLLAFDSTTTGAAQLVFKAHLRTVMVEGLREILAAGGKMEDALIKQFQYIRAMQTNEGITLLDAADKFESHSYTFAGLDSVLLQFGQQLSGASGIPLVRLFGQSPSGLNSTGESDLRMYYDNINKTQESALKEPVLLLYRVLAKSILGADLSEEATVDFSSLWQMTDKEKAEIATQDSNNISTLFNAGIIKKSVAMMELKQQSRITGRFTNITDEDITEAEGEDDLDLGGEEDLGPDEEEKKQTKDAQELYKGFTLFETESGISVKKDGIVKLKLGHTSIEQAKSVVDDIVKAMEGK
jgi:uncharacterized protein